MQFPPPKKRKFPLVDRSKYCKFHKDYSCDTNDCVMLKDEIESLIRKDKLGKYRWYEERIKWEEDGRRARSWSSRQEDTCRINLKEKQILSTVETISSGFARGDSLNNAQKWNLRVIMNMEPKKQRDQYELIYFTEEDIGDRLGTWWSHGYLSINT